MKSLGEKISISFAQFIGPPHIAIQSACMTNVPGEMAVTWNK